MTTEPGGSTSTSIHSCAALAGSKGAGAPRRRSGRGPRVSRPLKGPATRRDDSRGAPTCRRPAADGAAAGRKGGEGGSAPVVAVQRHRLEGRVGAGGRVDAPVDHLGRLRDGVEVDERADL